MLLYKEALAQFNPFLLKAKDPTEYSTGLTGKSQLHDEIRAFCRIYSQLVDPLKFAEDLQKATLLFAFFAENVEE